jgi:hypothetical protein
MVKATHPFAEEKSIKFPNTNRIDFIYSIITTVFIDNILIAVLNVPASVVCNNNVVAYDIEGEFLWRIDTTQKQYFGEQTNCPFVGANTTENEEGLLLYNWCDATLRVDHFTGEILERYQAR